MVGHDTVQADVSISSSYSAFKNYVLGLARRPGG